MALQQPKSHKLLWALLATSLVQKNFHSHSSCKASDKCHSSGHGQGAVTSMPKILEATARLGHSRSLILSWMRHGLRNTGTEWILPHSACRVCQLQSKLNLHAIVQSDICSLAACNHTEQAVENGPPIVFHRRVLQAAILSCLFPPPLLCSPNHTHPYMIIGMSNDPNL